MMNAPDETERILPGFRGAVFIICGSQSLHPSARRVAFVVTQWHIKNPWKPKMPAFGIYHYDVRFTLAARPSGNPCEAMRAMPVLRFGRRASP
jgi:hypothetical protein